MLAKRIIPCLDVTGGRVVKGVNFVNLRDAGDPVELARTLQPTKARTNWYSWTSPRRAMDRDTMVDVVAGALLAKFLFRLTVGRRYPVCGRRAKERAHAGGRQGGRQYGSSAPASRRRRAVAANSGRRPWYWQSTPAGVSGRWLERFHQGRPPRSKASTPSNGLPVGKHLGAGEILLTSMDTDGVQTGSRLRAHVSRKKRDAYSSDRQLAAQANLRISARCWQGADADRRWPPPSSTTAYTVRWPQEHFLRRADIASP